MKQPSYIVVWNKRSGIDDTSAVIETCLTGLRQNHTVVVVPIEDLASTYAQGLFSSNTSVKPGIVAVGGDGTIHACAQEAYRHDLVLSIVPTGTFNHFAKHLELPLAVPQAFDVLQAGKTTLVDLGMVNGRVFLNFASIGLYAQVIHERTQREELGESKWVGFSYALIEHLIHYRGLHLEVHMGDSSIIKKTPLVFVGNGQLRFGALDLLHTRETITAGVLQLSLLTDHGRTRLLMLAVRSMFMDIRHVLGFESVLLRSFSIRTHYGRTPAVVLDGEVVSLVSPLEFRSLPQALKLRVPHTTSAMHE